MKWEGLVWIWVQNNTEESVAEKKDCPGIDNYSCRGFTWISIGHCNVFSVYVGNFNLKKF